MFSKWKAQFLFDEAEPLVAKARHHILQEQDMLPLPPEIDPRKSGAAFARVDWGESRRLVGTLLLAVRPRLKVAYAFYAASVSLGLLQPVLVNRFVKKITEGLSGDADFAVAVALALALGASSIVRGSFLQQYFYGTLISFQKIVNAINEKLFRHSLTMTQDARTSVPIGDIVNFMGSDAETVGDFALVLAEIVSIVITVCGVSVMMFVYLGWTAIVPFVLLAALGPATRGIAKRFSHLDERMMRERDRRVTLMNQILNAIRVVKSFAWERSLVREVADVRSRELDARKRMARAEAYAGVMYVAVSSIVLFSALAVHVWRGFALDPALVFTCVSLFALLEEPLGSLSWMISRFTNAFVSAGRITSFLRSPTLSPTTVEPESIETALALRVEGLAALGGEDFILPAGQAVALVGPVGGGKSTFLASLLRERPDQRDRVQFLDAEGRRVCARTAFVPQEAYIVNGSLHDNLLFGTAGVPEEKIEAAVFAASFERDLQELPAGYRTEIGEKGVNLSGGQKQRVSLARAALRDPQVVFLDDPLSAVDVETERRLCDRLLFGLWIKKTRIVATHRLENLQRFDRILFIEDGRVSGDGTFDGLLGSSERFRSFIRDHELGRGALDVGDSHGEAVVAPKTIESRITDDEEREIGAVHRSVYLDYVRSLGGEGRWRFVSLGALLACSLVVMALPLLQRWWLGASSSAQQGLPMTGLARVLSDQGLVEVMKDPAESLWVFGGLGVLALSMTLLNGLMWLERGIRAGRLLHDRMLASLMKAPIRFFDSTPVGRILQRFSRDVESVDIHLQRSFEQLASILIEIVLCLGLILVTVPASILVIAPVLYLYYRVQNDYRRPSREAKRLDSIARSPRYAHFKETLVGLPVIRGFGREPWFLEHFFTHLARSQRMFYNHYLLNRWFSSRVPLIGGGIAMVTMVAVAFSARQGYLSAATAGLLTVSMLSFWGYLNWGIRIFSEIESRMTSVERLRAYAGLPAERDIVVPRKTDLAADWPARGALRFEDVTSRYASHLPLVLRGVSFEVKAGERVGLIGRTGSGKSTLLQALFRFVELEGGRISIDGEDVASVPLERLRRSLAIIPQDPTLFLGSIRSNLDRYGEYADADLIEALDKSSMWAFVNGLPEGLDHPVVENGLNLSQGQRQLLCLARALLTRAKIIVLDEATASVDVETDAILQKVIHEQLNGVTLLIIAHRLGTVSACHKVVELANGRVIAELSPQEARRELSRVESDRG